MSNKINYNKLDYKKIPTSILREAVYGLDGVHNRTLQKIDSVGPTEAAKIIGVTKQAVEYFRGYRQTKLETILKYAEKLGV